VTELLAFLTAYQSDRDLRKRTEAAIATRAEINQLVSDEIRISSDTLGT
jgi:hypothetical protein